MSHGAGSTTTRILSKSLRTFHYDFVQSCSVALQRTPTFSVPGSAGGEAKIAKRGVREVGGLKCRMSFCWLRRTLLDEKVTAQGVVLMAKEKDAEGVLYDTVLFIPCVHCNFEIRI